MLKIRCDSESLYDDYDVETSSLKKSVGGGYQQQQ